MLKKILFLIIGIFLINCINASTYNTTIDGAEFLVTTDNFTEFRQQLLTNYTHCHDNKANGTYHNYTRSFTMLCHIYFNNTDKVTWKDINLYFNMFSENINTSWPSIVQANNSQIEFNKVFVSGIGNAYESSLSNYGGNQYIGMREDLHIGTCHTSATNGDGLNTNYNSDTNFEIYNSAFSHHSYFKNSSLTNSTYIVNGLSFLCNGILNNTFWADSQPSGLTYAYGNGFGGITSSNSYLEKVSSMISYINYNLFTGSFTLNEGEDITYDHDSTNYCFVPTGGTANFTLKNALLKCGTTLSYGFVSSTNAEFYDCTADTYLSGGFWANWNVKNYFSIKQSFKNSNGDPVHVIYNFTDAQGTNYNGAGTSIDENILNYEYSNTGNIEYKPLTMNITNSSYFPVQNNELYMATNNKGIFPMIEIPYSITLNPNSNLNMVV